MWSEHLVPAPRGRRYCNPRRNRERWARRLARQEAFADGKASVETADEARMHRHSTDRLFRLLRAAIYQRRSDEYLVSLDDIAE